MKRLNIKIYFKFCVIMCSIYLSVSKNNLNLEEETKYFQENTIEYDEDHPCEKRTSMIIKYLLNQTSQVPKEYSEYYKFSIFSGTTLNDLGDYKGCKKLNISKYFIANIESQTFGNARIGICYLKECDLNYLNKTKYDVSLLLNTTANITINAEKLRINEPEYDLQKLRDSNLVGFYIVLSIMGLLVFISIFQYIVRSNSCKITSTGVDEQKISEITFFDDYKKKNSNHACYKFLQYFDFCKNSSKIIEIKNINETYKSLRIFDGIRVLCTFWVAFGHTFYIPAIFGIKNPTDIQNLAQKMHFTSLLVAFFAVDVFFYISGFLLYFGLQKYFNKKIKKFQIVIFAIINRYFRLLPLLLFTILGLTYIMPFIGDGPTYDDVSLINDSCKKYFWHNLLYFTNLYDYSDTLTKSMCAGHTWYLANDMQFFLISIIIFISLNNYKVIRNVIFGIIFIASNVISIYICLKNEYGSTGDLNHLADPKGTFMNQFYIKPWIRVSPYLLGLFFCELFLETPLYKNDYEEQNLDEKTKEKSAIFKMNLYLMQNNSASSIVFFVSFFFITITWIFPYFVNNYEFHIIWHALFNTFNKIFFIFGLGAIIHLTFLGKFKFIKTFLSFPVFTILSRITFGIYLTHFYVICWYFGSADSFTFIKFDDLFFLSLAFFTVTAVISFFISMIVESPVINAIKTILEGDKPKD